MPTSGVAKAKKSKATSRSANSFEILADQDRDKENDPSRSGTVQVQVERRPMADPRNSEVDTPIRKPRKINTKLGNSKDNLYAFIDTQNMPPTDTTTLIVNISVSASLASAPSYRRAGLLADRPFSILSDNSNDQKNKTLSDATLGMLYRRLELQDKHLEYQDELL